MYNKMVLGFYKNKTLSIVLLLICIVGSLAIGNVMKTMEGFQEGATTKTDAKESKLKETINTVLTNSKSTKEQCDEILNIIVKYLKKNDTNKTVTQTMNILAMNIDDDKKINLISILLTSDTI
jgi:anionic cell wall polymer biosynthesis LytR-Cps2A-Psr (LCP) family protein